MWPDALHSPHCRTAQACIFKLVIADFLFIFFFLKRILPAMLHLVWSNRACMCKHLLYPCGSSAIHTVKAQIQATFTSKFPAFSSSIHYRYRLVIRAVGTSQDRKTSQENGEHAQKVGCHVWTFLLWDLLWDEHYSTVLPGFSSRQWKLYSEKLYFQVKLQN